MVRGPHRSSGRNRIQPMTSPAPIDLKGSLFTLSVLKLLDTDLDRCLDALSAKIAQAPRFFEGAPLVVDVAALGEKPIDFRNLRQQLNRLQLVPVALTGASSALREAAREAGWPHLSGNGRSAPDESPRARRATSEPQPAAPAEPVTEPLQVEQPAKNFGAMTIDTPVRSGQQIYAKDCDLVVMGTVSNGAEVIADGSIHIYGTLRGRAIAGAKGDTKARIFCHNLQPELVAICGTYWLSSAIQPHWGQNGVIRLDGESLAFKALG